MPAAPAAAPAGPVGPEAGVGCCGGAPPGGGELAGSLPFALLSFDEGTRFYVLSESLAIETESHGTFQPSFSQVTSNDASTSAGLDFELDVVYADLQWALRLDEELVVGANLNVLSSETRFDTDTARFAKGESTAFGARAPRRFCAHSPAS